MVFQVFGMDAPHSESSFQRESSKESRNASENISDCLAFLKNFSLWTCAALVWEVSPPLNDRSNPVLTVSFDMLFVTTMVLLMIKLCEIFGSWFHQSSGHHPISFYDLFSLAYDVFHVPLPMLQQSHQHQNLLPLTYVEIIRPSCKNRGIAWAIKAVIKQSSKKKSLEQHQHTCDTYRSNRSLSLRW